MENFSEDLKATQEAHEKCRKSWRETLLSTKKLMSEDNNFEAILYIEYLKATIKQMKLLTEAHEKKIKEELIFLKAMEAILENKIP